MYSTSIQMKQVKTHKTNLSAETPRLSLSYISSVLFRVLPNQRYNLRYFTELYSSKEIKSYFKSVRTLQEYPNLYQMFCSRGFDVSLADEVRQSIKLTKDKFFFNIDQFINRCTDRTMFRGLCAINQSHLDYVSKKFHQEVFQNETPTFTRPTIDRLVSHINWKASMALPEPRLKKRDMYAEIVHYLELLNAEALSPQDIFTHPAAIFIRSQIRDSGLKVRTVHAVQGLQQCLESFFTVYFKDSLTMCSAIVLGLTQMEISNLVRSYDQYYTYSIDYKQWDNSRQPVLSVIAFELLRSYLPLSEYEDKILVTLRNIYLTLPSYHPNVELKRRWIGAVSGSGFTTLDNSICNFIMTHIIMFEYCTRAGLDPEEFTYKFSVTGDDLILATTVPIDINILFSIANEMFGAEAKLEAEVSAPGHSSLHYLGSNWVNGRPYRTERSLVASVIYGSGDFPKMSAYELMTSRFIEVFGNSADCGRQFKRLKLPVPKRLFKFNELTSPFKSGSPENRSFRDSEFENAGLTKSPDRRGFWFDTCINYDTLDLLWTSR